jgi:hypothetical protein
MKTNLSYLLSALIVSAGMSAQSPTCFSTPDGTDANSWSYKDYVIPTGYKLDSIMFTASRPGYPSNQDAFSMTYCPSSSSYSNCTGGKVTLNYANFTTSMYNVWLHVDTAHLIAPGMIRVVLPTNAGAVWGQVCFAISATSNCFSTPDGTDVNGWSYKDYVIPTGDKLDSVMFTATRPGYPTSQDAFSMMYCPSSSSYTNCTGGKVTLNYANFTTSMYNIWLRVDTANNTAPGLIRVILPTNAGAVWGQVCFAVSNQSSTGIKELQKNADFRVYPNPASDYVTVKVNGSENKPCMIELFDLVGSVIKTETKVSVSGENAFKINLTDVSTGLYFIRIKNSVQKIQVIK